EENERLGFVSDYARTNIHEDIAETGSEIDIDTMGISTTAFYNGNINPTVLAKLRVGENYGIIQKGTVAFLELEALYFTTFGERGSFNKKQAEDFLFASEAFLQQHPDSVYETTVRSHRGSIFKYYSISHPEKIREAIAEYERCLMVPFKDVVDYRVCLQHLEESYRRLENYALAGVYGAAGMLLDQRLQQNDPTLAKRGVNDFLAAKGISLF
ncbi:hypothetical protein HYS48_03475, partial [Candidatus Woesearchaeota archaeon]|nr:hypothetical protein [Candidatus Woesearchaeota archaeon]